MNDETGEVEDLTTTEEYVDLDTTETDGSSESESLDEIRAKLAKAEELATNYKIRAEKAEAKKTEVKTSPRKEKESDLSTMDIIALSKANIDTEDMPEVVEYAKFKGISISEALKSPVVKATIQERVEMRTTANASNTGGSRRVSGKLSDETLIANASKGNLPEAEDDIDRLVRAKMFKKR